MSRKPLLKNVVCSGGSTSSPQGKGGGGGRGGGRGGGDGGGRGGGEGAGDGGGEGGGDFGGDGGGGQASPEKQKPAEASVSWAVQVCSFELVAMRAGVPAPHTRKTVAFHLPTGPGQVPPLSYTCSLGLESAALYRPSSVGFTPPNSCTWIL